MVRYLRLYGYFLRFSFSKAMAFRLDFFFRIFMDVFYYAINIAFYAVIFHHTALLGGWDMDQMLVFVSGFLLIDAISMTVFANNLWFLPDAINTGNLDFYLIRPVSSLFMLSVRDFAADSFVNLVMAVVFMIWALGRSRPAFALSSILLFVVLILLGALLRYLLRMVFIIPTFWLHSGKGFDMVFFNLNRFIERPDRIFTGPMRVLLTTLLPFGVMASFPARILLDGFSWGVVLHMTVVTAAFAALVLLLWRRGLAAYSSASS